MYQRLSAFFSTGLLMLLAVALVSAQANCSALLSDALEAVEENCGDTGRNEACYGYDQVEASFLTDIEDTLFAQPTDKVGVADIATLRTAPLNTATGTWGVAIMNLQANLPNTLPGQSVTFVLMGDVEVENAVDPENAFNPSDGIEVVVNIEAGANIRSGPGLNFNVIGGATDNAVLLADGLSEDGEWLRVIYRERPAWVSLITIEDNPEIANLPTLTADLVTPMQAIYLRTGIGQPECADAPDDLLLVQGPDNIEIAITVNGADINLGSSGAIRVIEVDGELFLEIVVFDGQFETGGRVIQAGQRSVMCLGDAINSGADGEANDLSVTCDASVPEDVPTDEFGETWCILEDVPNSILNYGLEILCPGETPPPPIVNSAPISSNPDAPVSEIETVDCSDFAILNDSVVATDFVLSWTPVTGATEYHVAVLDSRGNEISTRTGITGTSIGVNGGDGFANSGAVHVRAFQNGNYACYASLGFANRVPDPNEPVGGYNNPVVLTFGVQLVECRRLGGGDDYSAVFSWQNATSPIVFQTSTDMESQSGPNGSFEFFSFVIGDPEAISVSSGSASFSFTCSTFVDL